MTELRSPSGLALTLATITTLAALGGATAFLGSRLGSLSERVSQIEQDSGRLVRTTALIRLEDKSRGRGIGAIVEQIEHYGPLLASAGTSAPSAKTITEALEEALLAVEALGRDSFSRLRAELDQNSTIDTETRRWLLRAAIRSDRAAGLDLTAQLARGTAMAPDAATRLMAARELLATDKALAGVVLHQIVDIESARGVTRQPPPELAADYERTIPTTIGSQFSNLVDLYAQTDHPEIELTLRQILGRKEHDLLTYKECIVALARMKSQGAVSQIKELYDEPPGREFNPLFQNTCVQAIADIDGARACEWMREKLKTEQSQMVAARLQELVKQLCGGG